MFDLQESDNDKDIAEVLLYLQHNVRLQKSSKEHLDVVTLVEGKNFKVTPKAGEPPRLVVLSDSLQDGLYTSGFIHADSVLVEYIPKAGILGMVLQLVYAYYVWDLSYPKQYQMLGFIQEKVYKDDESKFFKSTNFKNFEKKYEVVEMRIEQ